MRATLAAQSEIIESVVLAERFYATLARLASPAGQEPSLGGKLLYVGELDARSRPLVIAGNVVGAATLTATAEMQAQKQAIRDGVVDFLVTSLDEALRILKNEIRKRERVAVCVGVAPATIEQQIRERGIQPDLLREQAEAGLGNGTPSTSIWSVDTAPAHWLPTLDKIALECLKASQLTERRWLRVAPRHLGRTAFGVRVLSAGEAFASCFAERARASVETGEIATAVTLLRKTGDAVDEQRFTPRC